MRREEAGRGGDEARWLGGEEGDGRKGVEGGRDNKGGITGAT